MKFEYIKIEFDNRKLAVREDKFNIVLFYLMGFIEFEELQKHLNEKELVIPYN